MTEPPNEADDFDVADGGMWWDLDLPAYGQLVADRGRELWVPRLADGGLLIDTANPSEPLRRGLMLVWLDRAGREVRRRSWNTAELRRRVLASWRIDS